MNPVSSLPNATGQKPGLTWGDAAILVLLCMVLYGYTLVHHRELTTHQAIHCENVREMFVSGDWIIPTYGSRPWLERPPLPHWATGAAAALVGGLDQDWAMRIGSILAGLAAVVLTARMAAVWYGRTIGLLSGAVLATMREFSSYSTGPEADIFLCTMVTAAHALAVQWEFAERPGETAARVGFLGKRSWTLLVFFVVLGLTNLTKGPIFGMVFVLAPMAGYFLWSADWSGMRRYVWLWGWLAFAVAAGAWYAAACWRYPDMIDLWFKTFYARIGTEYNHEPFWYYLVFQPWNAFPWALPALLGLGLTARKAFRERRSPERYLWCWAISPVVLFSITESKHHHYLLHCLAPLAVLGALGAVQCWRWLSEQPAWLRQPWLATLLLGAAGDAALAVVGSRIPGTAWLQPALLVGWPVVVCLMWYAAGQRNGRVAAAAFFVLLTAVECLEYAHRVEFLDSYSDDVAFLHEANSLTPPDQNVVVMNDTHPLTAAWFLFYLQGRGQLLHNVTFLQGDNLSAEIFLISRSSDLPALTQYGTPEMLLQSQHTRGERSPDDRWALFHLRFRSDLKRLPANIRISPAQAAGLAPGPDLK